MDLSVGCEHPVRVAGMCAICGIAVEDDEHDTSASQSQQLHDISGVQVSSAEAARLDSESTKHLLSNRKLALIVDLDQTIIHATVDPTVGEWKNDLQNPNYQALVNVGKFRLGTDGKAIEEDAEKTDGSVSSTSNGTQQHEEGCWYYVKPRPRLDNFLTELATKFEMYVYTMGTRSYAESVCKLVDPKGIIFGARILSRDENGSLLQKSLKKLFPMDTSMVVIIDDRADVWKWSPHLVKVIPFDFFVGIGDINASFLPNAPLAAAPSSEAQSVEESKEKADAAKGGEKSSQNGKSGEENSEVVAVEEDRTKKEEAEAAAVAESSQRTIVSEQLGSRPLAKMQEALDVKMDAGNPAEHTRHPSAVLHDDDTELNRLQKILDQIHKSWYGSWDAGSKDDSKPATTSIIANLKSTVLAGCTIVFSSVIQLQQAPETSDFWRLACEFGATCKTEIDSSVTHIVAAKPDTQKVLLGHKNKMSVVWPAWLHDSCATWSRRPEEEYTLPRPSEDKIQSSDMGGLSSDSSQLFTSWDTDQAIGDGGLTGAITGEDEEQEGAGFGAMNWDEANDEVDAVLNGLSDDDEDGTEDGGYTTDGSATRPIKRTLSARSSNADAEDLRERDEDATASPLSKRRRMAESRMGQSKLKNAVAVHQTGQESESNSKTVSEDGRADDSIYVGTTARSEAGDSGDEDFLKSLQDELEMQLAGEGGDTSEGLASDDE